MRIGDPDLGGFRPLSTTELADLPGATSREYNRSHAVPHRDWEILGESCRPSAARAAPARPLDQPSPGVPVEAHEAQPVDTGSIEGSFDGTSGTIKLTREGEDLVHLHWGHRYNIKVGNFQHGDVKAGHAVWVAMVALSNGLAFEYEPA